MKNKKDKKQTLSAIGLDVKLSKQLAEGLDKLSTNYHIFYQNARGYHWNIKGEKFFELHLKFEELYNDALLKIDELAERILTLGYTPTHSFSEYLAAAEIKEHTNVSDGKKALEQILNNYGILISIERELLALSAEAGDEGTNALMSDYLRQQEKLIWMYSAYLNR